MFGFPSPSFLRWIGVWPLPVRCSVFGFWLLVYVCVKINGCIWMMVISGVQSVGLNKRFALLYTYERYACTFVSVCVCVYIESWWTHCVLLVFFLLLLLQSDFPLPALLDFEVGSSSFCYFMNLISVDFTSLC